MAPTTLVVGALPGCARNPSRRLLRLPSQIAMLNETLAASEICKRCFSSEVAAKFVLFFLAARWSAERKSALVSPVSKRLTLMALCSSSFPDRSGFLKRSFHVDCCDGQPLRPEGQTENETMTFMAFYFSSVCAFFLPQTRRRCKRVSLRNVSIRRLSVIVDPEI